MTGTAGIVYDLRNFFPPAVYDADGGTDAEGAPGSAGGPHTDADGSNAANGGDGSSADGTGDAAGDGEEIKDPARKKLSDEAAAYRVRAKTAEASLATATESPAIRRPSFAIRDGKPGSGEDDCRTCDFSRHALSKCLVNRCAGTSGAGGSKNSVR